MYVSTARTGSKNSFERVTRKWDGRIMVWIFPQSIKCRRAILIHLTFADMVLLLKDLLFESDFISSFRIFEGKKRNNKLVCKLKQELDQFKVKNVGLNPCGSIKKV